MPAACLRRWVDAALVIAEAGDDTALLLRAYEAKEALLVPARAGDDDILVLVNHALVAGLETAEGAAALRTAFELDRAAFAGGGGGAAADGGGASFVRRWAPRGDDFEGVAEAVLEALAISK